VQSHVSGASRDYQDPHRFPTSGTGQAREVSKAKSPSRLAIDPVVAAYVEPQVTGEGDDALDGLPVEFCRVFGGV
jgi:hypothetical protein